MPGATLVDSFPAELISITWNCVGSGGGICQSSGAGDIDESIDLPAGASVVFTAMATVDPGATGATLENTATVVCPAGAIDRNPADNTAPGVQTSPL